MLSIACSTEYGCRFYRTEEYMSVDPQGRCLFGTGTLNCPQSDWLTSIVVGSDGTLSFARRQPFELPYGNNGLPPKQPQ
jgi:hypothetical protein